MTMTADSAVQSQQRAEVYWFLASLFGNPIDSDTLARITDIAAGTLIEETGFADNLHAALAGEEELEALTERLAMEHTRLFLGLREGYGPPPPYESLWREDRIMGDSTMAVATAYSEAGFDDNGPWGPCDHIAYELRFMASLCNAETEAEHAGQPDEADWAKTRQIGFIDEHLLAWIPAYCRQLADQAKEPLYAALAQVTEQVLAEDSIAVRRKIENAGAECGPLSGSGLGERVEA